MERTTISKPGGAGAFAYGILCYEVFLEVFVYAVGFIGGFLTPTRLDGAPTRPFWQALAIDLGLLGLFAVQHSVMARPAFKRWWTRFVPEAVERSTYVLLSSLALVALFVWWEPMGGIVWDTGGPVRGRRHRALPARLGAAALHHLPDRPFRPVRAEAGVAAAARKPLRTARNSTRRASTRSSATRSTSAG